MKQLCDHCELPIPQGVIIEEQNKSFCCHACKTVFQFIHHSKLDEYYEIKSSLNLNEKKRAQFIVRNKHLEQIDSLGFQKRFLLNGPGKTIKFYIDGMHCFACVWLLEKLQTLSTDIMEIRVNYFEKSLTLSIAESATFIETIEVIQKLGYNLYPVASDSDLEKVKKEKQHELLSRVSVAAICAGNIMICAIAVYAGADEYWKTLLERLSGAFFIPILFYSSTPILKNAFHSLKNRRYVLDIAAAFSIILGATLSYYHLLKGSGAIYFDSLGTFVFLLIGAKYILLCSNNRAAHLDTIDYRLGSDHYFKVIENSEHGIERCKISTEDIAEGDMILLQPGDTCPVDGTVWNGESYFDNSAISGESQPIKVKAGAKISSGSKNIESEILLKCSSNAMNSSMGILLDSISKSWKQSNSITGLTETLSFFLFICVVLACLGTTSFLLWSNQSEEIFPRLLAILVIACPCALGIGTPLALGFSLKSLVQKGILVKNADVLVAASKISTIFFDKTGTLTNGSQTLTAWRGERNDSLEDIIFNLESISLHPIAQSLCMSLSEKRNIPKINFVDHLEKKGKGVSGKIGTDTWSMEKFSGTEDNGDYPNATASTLKKNGATVAVLYFRDELKPESINLISKLADLQISAGILSGDRASVVNYWAQTLGLSPGHIYSNLSPQDKSDLIKNTKRAAMVGDGINDALALKESALGIAVKGSLSASLKSGDVILLENNLFKIIELIEFSRKVLNLIRRNVIWSLIYNIGGVSLAAFGFVNPLVAAVLMPISSVFVVFNISMFFYRPTATMSALSLESSYAK